MANIAILGAGATGSFLGCRLANAGHQTTLIGKGKLIKTFANPELQLLNLQGQSLGIDRRRLTITDDISLLKEAELILVTVKCKDMSQAAHAIEQYAQKSACVVSCQNGLMGAKHLRQTIRQQVLTCVINFNVIWQSHDFFQQTTQGELIIENDGSSQSQQLAHWLTQAGIDIKLDTHMDGILLGKLLLNMNNAVNALAGIPLKDVLTDKTYRTILAALIRETLWVYRKNNLQAKQVGKTPLKLLPLGLRLPNFIFNRVAKGFLDVSPFAYSSMCADLMQCRPTEIDDINGMIIKMAKQAGVDAPLNQRIYNLIRQAEQQQQGSPNMTAFELRHALHL